MVLTVTGGSNFNYANVDMTQVRNVYLTGADAEQFRVSDVSVNSKNQLKVHIVPKAEAQLETNRTYRYGFAVEADNIVIESSIYSVKTKQSALQIKAAGDTTVYQSRTRGQIEIVVKAPAEAKIAAVEILSAGTTVPKGAVEFTARENGNGTYTVDYTVTKSTKLKAGKTYRLALKVTPEGNATNKAPQTVYATLNVKR